MRNGPWTIISLTLGGGAFIGGRETVSRAPALCPPADARPCGTPHSAAQQVDASAAAPIVLRGRLFIDCTPSRNVNVALDGRPLGDVCPIETDATMGRHTIDISASNYRTERRIVTVAPNALTKVAFALEDNAGLFYRQRIEFPELRAGAVDDIRDDKVAVVSGRVANRGDRAVKEIQLAVEFLDADGRPLVRRFIHPVLETQSGSMQPGTDKSFEAKVPDVPMASWSRQIRWSVSFINVAPPPPN